jgi:adenylyltransferase/sulfurtransferase
VKTAVLLGAGGLGCPAGLALREQMSAAELRLVIVDPDRVDRSNLSRQILFGERDVGAFKAEVAARRLDAVARVAKLDAASAGAILAEADVVLDGTDDFATRFLANDEAVRRGVPLVHGAALGWSGQVMTIVPGRTGCLRCLFEGPPPQGDGPACAEAGVLSPLCGLVGATMALAAVQVLDEKKIIFFSAPPPGVFHRWDALVGTERSVAVRRDPACAACGRVAS